MVVILIIMFYLFLAEDRESSDRKNEKSKKRDRVSY